jgi:hypothetical protein
MFAYKSHVATYQTTMLIKHCMQAIHHQVYKVKHQSQIEKVPPRSPTFILTLIRGSMLAP